MEATIDKSEVRQWNRYEKYRSSGASWHQEVPATWEVRRLKFLSETNPSKSEVSNLPSDTEVSFLPMEQVGEDGSLSLDRTKTIEDVYQGFTYFRDGDVLVAKITPCFENGKGALAQGLTNGIGFGTTEFHVLRPNDEIDGRYLELITRLHAFRGKGVSEFTGAAGQQRIPESFLTDYLAPVPPLPEQRAIAAFLDRETARIDALIGHKERLIALLEEKRQAVISHAVTRGLDPNAKMQDTDIPWMRKIPDHWELRKVAHLFKAGKGSRGQELTKQYCATNAGPYPVYSGQTENDGVMGTLEDYEFDFGDEGVLFSTTVGAKAMHVKHLKGRFSLSQNCMIIWPLSEKIRMRFYLHHFGPLFAFERRLIPDHMQASFRMEDLYGFKVGVPPIEEQLAIASFLESHDSKLRIARSRIQDSIQRLQEYRTALISAAVTGQIDVREEVFAQNG